MKERGREGRQRTARWGGAERRRAEKGGKGFWRAKREVPRRASVRSDRNRRMTVWTETSLREKMELPHHLIFDFTEGCCKWNWKAKLIFLNDTVHVTKKKLLKKGNVITTLCKSYVQSHNKVKNVKGFN